MMSTFFPIALARLRHSASDTDHIESWLLLAGEMVRHPFL